MKPNNTFTMIYAIIAALLWTAIIACAYIPALRRREIPAGWKLWASAGIDILAMVLLAALAGWPVFWAYVIARVVIGAIIWTTSYFYFRKKRS